MEIEAEFGEILLIIDEVFSEMHKFKFMGFKVEAKKTIRIISVLFDSISSSLGPVLRQVRDAQKATLELARKK